MTTKKSKPTDKEDQRGGARPNSGPKPKYPEKKNRTIALTDTAIEIVDNAGEPLKMSRSDALEQIVREWKAAGGRLDVEVRP